MNTRAAACTVLLALAALTAGCSSSSDDKPTQPAPSTKTYSYADCVALLEYDYTEGQPQDAARDPECSHLTRDQYLKAVAEVLTAHKEEILEDAQ